MNQAVLGLLARHILSAAGAVLVSKGLVAASAIEPAIGAVMVLGGLVWSIVQKHKSGALAGPP